MDVVAVREDGSCDVLTDDGEVRPMRLVVDFRGALRVAPPSEGPSHDQEGEARAGRWSVDQA